MNNGLNKVTVFDNYEIVKAEPGEAILTSVVTEDSLNLYGIAHGGYLYTLCDTVSGMAALQYGVYVVTLSSSMNFMEAAQKGDTVTVHAVCIHNGMKTKVMHTTVTNQKGEQLCDSTFTMYVTGRIEETE